MEYLLSLSIALFVGLMLSRVAKILKLPAVTAYLVAGILVGPFCLGAFGVPGLGFGSLEMVEELSILSDVALGGTVAVGGCGICGKSCRHSLDKI